MNILITGANGFLAKEMRDYYSQQEGVNIFLTDRTTLNPTDFLDVQRFFNENKVDVVIHAAVRGGKRGHKEQVEDIFDNVSMFQNLAYFSDKFKYMFHFGSGAEFNRTLPIDNAKETSVNISLPPDYYGLTKNIIARKIVKMNSNIYNLRLFGCFGRHEESQRLFRACYDKLRLNKEPTISHDKYMDYFYAQDVGRVIDFIIHADHTVLPRDINLCYPEKYTLSEHVERIKQLTKAESQVIIDYEELGKPYTGESVTLDSLNIDLIGLDKGVNECLKSWSKS